MENKASVVDKIKSWKGADQALSRLSRIEEGLERVRRKADERIERIEQRLGEENAGLLSEALCLRQELERFFRGNARRIRSRTLPSGRIGLKTTSTLRIRNEETTLNRILERGLGDCLRITQKIDRQALRRLDDETLTSLGVRRIETETFYISPSPRERSS